MAAAARTGSAEMTEEVYGKAFRGPVDDQTKLV